MDIVHEGVNKVFGDWIYYERGPSALPEWCMFYGELGRQAATSDSKNSRCIIALALPTRAYAAIFIALGIVLERIKVRIEEEDAAYYFLRLCNLPRGTPVYYFENNKRFKAKTDGYEERSGSSYIALRLNNGNKRSLVPSNLIHNIQEADEHFEQLSKVSRGRKLVDNKGFVEANVSPANRSVFYRYSRLECTIIGNKKKILEEAKLQVGLQHKTIIQGTPSDILRIHEDSKPGQAYRTSIRSDREKKLVPNHRVPPHTVIFDGAAGYLRWRDHWKSSNWIILLDRTENQFEEAVNTMNQEYHNRSKDASFPLPKIATSIDAITYEIGKA